MDEHSKYAFIGICHEGNVASDRDWARGILDDVISKDYATLDAVTNDVDMILNHFSNNELCISSYKLVNPSIGQIIRCINKAVQDINQSEKSDSNKHALGIYYSGHGHIDDGAMQLSNGLLSSDEIYHNINSFYQGNRLQVDFILDSCHSGKFIARVLRTQQEDKSSKIYLYDLWASCFPEEKSFELQTLQHGVFTYCFLNKGNSHVDQSDFARAINNISINEKTNSVDKKTVRNIFKYIQGFGVPNPVTLMSLGKQHSFNIYRSHTVATDGGASFELPEKITLAGFSNTLERAKETYEGNIEYSDDYFS